MLVSSEREMQNYSEKHNRRSIRLKCYDYTKSGYYFVTICSRNRECIFGDFNVGALLACARTDIELSIIGNVVDKHWNDIPNQYENVSLDKYIIMANHIHGIIIIDNDITNIQKRAQASSAPTSSIGQIIRSFKSKSSVEYLKYIKENNLNISGKIWQRNYYEHIIRNDHELEKIREYIELNPLKWYEDKYNPLSKKNLTNRLT